MKLTKEMTNNDPPKDGLREVEDELRKEVWGKAKQTVGPKKDERDKPNGCFSQKIGTAKYNQITIDKVRNCEGPAKKTTQPEASSRENPDRTGACP